MKAATRIVLCSLVALLFQLSLAYAAPPLAGKWVNVDASTNSITRLEVTEEADGWVIRAWGKCGPPDFDWGTVPLHMAVDSDGPDKPVDVQRLKHGVAYWDHKKADIRTFMTLQVRDGELVVESFDVFGTSVRAAQGNATLPSEGLVQEGGVSTHRTSRWISRRIESSGNVEPMVRR